MDTTGKFALKLGIYSFVLAYIAVDLWWFGGPLHQGIERVYRKRVDGSRGGHQGVIVARVFNHLIDADQLERALRERLWLNGMNEDSMSPERLQRYRLAALNDLIDHELLRVKTKANGDLVKVSEGELDLRYREYLKRFVNEAACEKSLHEQGLGTLGDLKDRLRAQMEQEKYIQMRLQSALVVSEDEVFEWYQAHREKFVNPERVRLRHVFMATLDRSPEQVKQQLDVALKDLLEHKQGFEEWVKRLSEDENSKARGGDLGWVSRARMPEELASVVFQMGLNQPRLVQSKLGWHLVEVLERRKESIRPYEAIREELKQALVTQKTEQMIAKYRSDLRQFEKEKIEVFLDR